MSNWSLKNIQGGGKSFSYLDNGKAGAPVLLFLHGLAGTKDHFRFQMEHFDPAYRIIAPDLLGHGQSSSDLAPSFSDLVTQANLLIDNLKSKTVHLVGHSLGAGVALEAAANSAVKSVVLLDPMVDMRKLSDKEREQFIPTSPIEYKKVMQAWWEAILTNAKEPVKAMVFKDLWALTQETFQTIFKTSLEFDPVSTFRTLKVPVLNLYTELNRDPRSLQNLCPELDSELFSGVSHWLQLDAPMGVNKRIKAFLTAPS